MFYTSAAAPWLGSGNMRTLVRLQQQAEIRPFRGRLRWDGDLEFQRLDADAVIVVDASVWIDVFNVVQLNGRLL